MSNELEQRRGTVGYDNNANRTAQETASQREVGTAIVNGARRGRSRRVAPLGRGACLVACLVAGQVATTARAEEPAAGPAPAATQAATAPAATENAPPPSASATPLAIPTWRLVLNNLAVFRYNPLGIENQIRFGVQRKLYDHKKDLFRDNFFFAGVLPKLNPAYLKIGPSIEVQPLSILNVKAYFEYINFFSTFGFLQSFQSPLEDYSETALQAGRDAKLNYSTTGIHFGIEPMIQLKLGPVLLRNRFAAEFWHMNVHPGDTVFYDATLDTLVPANGWIIADDLDLAYIKRFQNGSQLVVGARYSVVKPLYGRDQFQTDAQWDTYQGKLQTPTDAQKALADANTHMRLGPLIAYTFFDRGFVKFNKPTLLLITGWYLEHRFRTGADQPEALPYIVAGFSFQSDVLKE